MELRRSRKLNEAVKIHVKDWVAVAAWYLVRWSLRIVEPGSVMNSCKSPKRPAAIHMAGSQLLRWCPIERISSVGIDGPILWEARKN
jgi:hypothetical protein